MRGERKNAMRCVSKDNAVHGQSKGDSLHRLRHCGALAKTLRCDGKDNAVTLPGHRIAFSEQIYCMGRCRYTATAVEDILNGQRSTTAIPLCSLSSDAVRYVATHLVLKNPSPHSEIWGDGFLVLFVRIRAIIPG